MQFNTKRDLTEDTRSQYFYRGRAKRQLLKSQEVVVIQTNMYRSQSRVISPSSSPMTRSNGVFVVTWTHEQWLWSVLTRLNKPWLPGRCPKTTRNTKLVFHPFSGALWSIGKGGRKGKDSLEVVSMTLMTYNNLPSHTSPGQLLCCHCFGHSTSTCNYVPKKKKLST